MSGENKKLSPSQQKIVDLLIDMKVHCTAHEMYQKDDRTRISELRRMGFVFNEKAGNCKDLNHHHDADLKLRQLISVPEWYLSRGGLTVGRLAHNQEIAGAIPAPATKLLPMTKKIRDWNKQFYPEPAKQKIQSLF